MTVQWRAHLGLFLEVDCNAALEVEGSNYVWRVGLHCHAGIPQPGLYQLLCKVAIHIVQSAKNGGSAFGTVWK